jgi:hypothetical protein
MQREITMKSLAPVLERNRGSNARVSEYRAWSAPAAGGTLSMREQLGANSSRAVWDLDRGRLALTVTEHASVADALNALADDMEANQLAELPRGPEDIGEISFVHPEPAPPAVFFVRGNLTIGVFSFGKEQIDVLPFAKRVDDDVLQRANAGRGKE